MGEFPIVFKHFLSFSQLLYCCVNDYRNKRPPITFKILCYAFLMGLLQLSKFPLQLITTSIIFFKLMFFFSFMLIHIYTRVTLCQMLLTMALQYISSTYESIALNMVPTITFVLALIFHQEKLRFRSINGQAKIWGLGISLGGALALVLWKGPVVVKAMLSISFDATGDSVLGWILTIVGVIATSFWNILVVRSKSLFIFFFLFLEI